MAWRSTRVAICQADHSTRLNITALGLHSMLLLVLCPLGPAEEDLDYSATTQSACSTPSAMTIQGISTRNLIFFSASSMPLFVLASAGEGTQREGKGSAREARHTNQGQLVFPFVFSGTPAKGDFR